MNNNTEIFCLELKLIPLSELLFRQVGKSNVQWFTYPFIPPTTFSGLLYSAIFPSTKNFIEENDNKARQLQQKYPGIIPIGAYPLIPEQSLYQPKKHYRQHVGDKYNYEGQVQQTKITSATGKKSNVGKKLAIVENLWASSLRGFLLSHDETQLNEVRERVEYKICRAGKKGVVKIEGYQFYLLNEEFREEVTSSSIAPVEVGIKLESGTTLRLYHVPIKLLEDEKVVKWHIHPCFFGVKIKDLCMVNDLKGTYIPKKIVEIITEK